MQYYDRLKALRDDKDLSQVEVASILKTTQQQVYKVQKKGHTRNDCKPLKDSVRVLRSISRLHFRIAEGVTVAEVVYSLVSIPQFTLW